MAGALVEEKIMCVFCYKPVIKENQAITKYVYGNETNTIAHSIATSLNPLEALTICEKFFTQIQRPVGHYSAPRVKGKNDDDIPISCLRGGEIVPVWNPNKMGICSSCFFVMENHVFLYEKMEKAQRKLKWQLDRFYNVLKGAAKIPSRIEEFEEHLGNDSKKPAMIEFRRSVLKICNRKLKKIEEAQLETVEETKSMPVLEPNASQADRVPTPPASIPEESSQDERPSFQPNADSGDSEDEFAPVTIRGGKVTRTKGGAKNKVIRKKKTGKAEKKTVENTGSMPVLEPNTSKADSVQAPPTSSAQQNEDSDEDFVPVPIRGSKAKGVAKKTASRKPSAKPKSGFQCSACPKEFRTQKGLEKHASQHYTLKTEAGISENEEDIPEPASMVECNVEIVKGSLEEQMQLDECLENDMREESDGNCSDSDPEVRKNYKALMEIVRNLRPHNVPGETDAQPGSSKTVSQGKKKVPIAKSRKVKQKPENKSTIISQQTGSGNLEITGEPDRQPGTSTNINVSATVSGKRVRKPVAKFTKWIQSRRKFKKPNKEVKVENEEMVQRKGDTPEKIQIKVEIVKKPKRVRIPKPKRKKIRCSMQCEKCGLCFTAKNITTAKILLFRHLKKTSLHNGNLTWEHFCQCCGSIFLNTKKLKAHVFAKHREDPRIKRFSCSHCNRRFLLKANLVKHFTASHKNFVEMVEDSETSKVIAKVEAFVVKHQRDSD